MDNPNPRRVSPALGLEDGVVNAILAISYCICELNEEFSNCPLFRWLILSPTFM